MTITTIIKMINRDVLNNLELVLPMDSVSHVLIVRITEDIY